MSLFNELKRRNIFRVAAAYIIVGWLLLQISDVLVPALYLPGWFHSGVAFLLILGFPVAMILAWAFELTPEGIKKEKEVDRSESATGHTGRKLDYVIIGLLAVALVYFVWESRFEDDAVVPAEIISETDQLTETHSTATKQSIAVLPFDNRSSLEEDQFFTDGIHDDLLTTIAKIGSMKVISRTSVMEYKNTIKKIPVIAKELGVANILEGGIQRSGNQVRINVQLIDAQTDEHLWAEIYDRELTAENLFSIQSEISKAIATALHATLSPDEERRIDAMPTNNLRAFEAYQRGKQLMATRQPEKLRLAVEEFSKAVELDPEFALAWVGVADSNRLYPNYAGLKQEDFFSTREDATNRALAIDEKLGEAYVSLGSLYYDQNQNEKSEAAYKEAIMLSPNYATGWQWYSALIGRNPLRVDEAIELLSKAAELDPRSSIIGMNLAGQYRQRGLYSLAEHQYLKLNDIDPTFMLAQIQLTSFYLYELSRFDLALAESQKLIELDPSNLRFLEMQARIFTQLGKFTEAESILKRMKALDAEHVRVGFAALQISLYQNDSATIREDINWLFLKVENMPGYIDFLAYVELILGNNDRARELYLSLHPGWLDPDVSLDQRVLQSHGCLISWMFLVTDEVERGQKLLQQTIILFDETLPDTQDHLDFDRPEICYLAAGDTEKALQSIETQLAHNHLEGWGFDHRLAAYDLIRNEPRYQAVLRERERKIAVQREAVEKLEIAK